MAAPLLSLFFLLLHLPLLLAGPPANHHPDLAALLSFKASSDAGNKLSSWTNFSDPCNTSTIFHGVSCLHNRVTLLVLEDLDLYGRFDSLASLVELRVLSLKRNRLTGPIPDLSNLTSLKLVFLSYNNISGEFPSSLPSLFRLDLSHNNISGEIPATLNRLTQLLTLRLEQNQFSGNIPFLDLPDLQEFNVSGNKFSGEIPTTLSGFPESAFSKNPVLCGYPLHDCTGSPSPVVSSSPTTPPLTAALPSHKTAGNNRHGAGGKISPLAIAAIIIGDVLILSLVSLILYCYFCQNFAGESMPRKKEVRLPEKMVNTQVNSGFEKGKMVFFDESRRFELEELLRASAEMLGKGGFGTTYKAVLDDSKVVAVKRLTAASIAGRREFEERMEVLGRLRHVNVVSLKAYYFAKDEKLLVYDYMTNGNLFWLLHGNRGPGRTPLDWSTRLKIAAGAARGLAFIHTAGDDSGKLTHGNIKSTNILLDDSGNACVSDFGLSAFSPPTAGPKSSGYDAPELSPANSRKTTQKSDVYSFGVLLLELLTGKCPSMAENGVVLDLPRWVQSVVREEWTAEVFDLELMRYKDIEEEMVGLLQIGLSCTSAAPNQRPTMDHVIKMVNDILNDIQGVVVSQNRDTFDSVSDSPRLQCYKGGESTSSIHLF